jgi:hypothetical protein
MDEQEYDQVPVSQERFIGTFGSAYAARLTPHLPRRGIWASMQRADEGRIIVPGSSDDPTGFLFSIQSCFVGKHDARPMLFWQR